MKQRSTIYHAQALTRGLAILRMLAQERKALGIKELHEQMGLPKSTLVRLLSVLEDGGYVARYGETYLLGHAVQDLVEAYEDTVGVPVLARDYLAPLAEATGQTANLGILERDQVRHLAIAEPDRPLRFRSTTGSLDDAYCTGLGKALLAALPSNEVDRHLPREPFTRRTENTLVDGAALLDELEQVRVQGFAVDNEEGDIGVRCLAVPLDLKAGASAALSVAGPAGEFSAEGREAYLDHLTKAAAAMASDHRMVAALRVAIRRTGEAP